MLRPPLSWKGGGLQNDVHTDSSHLNDNTPPSTFYEKWSWPQWQIYRMGVPGNKGIYGFSRHREPTAYANAAAGGAKIYRMGVPGNKGIYGFPWHREPTAYVNRDELT